MKQELRRKIKNLPGETSQQWPHEEMVALPDVLRVIDQLDEPEVLSQEWIDEHAVYASFDGTTKEHVHVIDLQNLVVPKRELPVIPKFVADWIYDLKSKKINMLESICDFPQGEDIHDYMREKSDVLMRAWLDGYEVEKEQKYYALVKGHEVIDDYANIKYWNSDTFDKHVFIGDRYVVRRWVLTKMRKSEWNKFGINDSNADFVKVEDVEE